MHERIRTADLLIRPFAEKDAESFARNVLKDSTLASFFDGESAEEYIRERMKYADHARFYDCVILLGKEAIGEINAAYIPDGIADIGYVLAEPYRSKGYGRQAVQAWTEYLFRQGIHTVYGACRKDNPASAAVMRHAGMTAAERVPDSVRRREKEDGLLYFCRRG